MKSNLQAICQFLQQGLIERAEAVHLSLLAALSGEHLLLLGAPGTAKSLLARKLHRVINAEAYFERLLTRFSVPEELFGPLSIKALEQDQYLRLTSGYLPQASIAFIDEVFKANSAILNALLTLLNEREFDNGLKRTKTPLVCVLAASNELPQEDELQALYDRFLLRYQVEAVSDQGFAQLLRLPADTAESASQVQELSDKQTQSFNALDMDVLRAIQQQAQNITLDEAAQSLLFSLRGWLQSQSIQVSDRRWRKAVKLLQVAALTNQQQVINHWDCSLLIHVLWEEPEQKTLLSDWFAACYELQIDTAVSRAEKLLSTWESKLTEDARRYHHKSNEQGQPLYTTPEGEVTTQHERVVLALRNGEALYLAPPDHEDRTRQGQGYTLAELEQQFFDKSFKQTHIDGRWVDVQNYINNTQNRLVERSEYAPLTEAYYFSQDYIDHQRQELDGVIEQVKQLSTHYQQLYHSLNTLLDNHLWLSHGLLHEAEQHIKRRLPELIDFQQRLAELVKINARLEVMPSREVS